MIPEYFPGEKEAIDRVLYAGAMFGYGNMISHLERAWSKKLQADGIDQYGADMAAGTICAWCKVDHRTGKKAVPPA